MRGDFVFKEEWRKNAIKKRNGARKPTISIYNWISYIKKLLFLFLSFDEVKILFNYQII